MDKNNIVIVAVGILLTGLGIMSMVSKKPVALNQDRTIVQPENTEPPKKEEPTFNTPPLKDGEENNEAPKVKT